MAEEAEDEGDEEEGEERKELNQKVTLELPAGQVDHCLDVAEEKMPGRGPRRGGQRDMSKVGERIIEFKRGPPCPWRG